jgi:flavorubredoxin
MAVSEKYGRISIPKIGEDEPVFVLRAQDKLAEPTIEMYQALARSHGASVADDVHTQIRAFQEWTGQKKLPD